MFGWDDNHVLSSPDNSGRIDEHTDGPIVDTETIGDLRVGQIQSTGDDVTLWSPGAILDAELDDGTLGTDPTDTDVIARNITLFAGNNGIGGVSGHGGIGLPYDFLEIQVNANGGALGVLNAFDISTGTAPYNVLFAAVAAAVLRHLRRVHARDRRRHGDRAGHLEGRRLADALVGSLVDANNGGLGDDSADVIGNTIDLAAFGDIGAKDGTNDLEIDSQHYAYGTVGASALGNIHVTETSGSANVVLLRSFGSDYTFLGATGGLFSEPTIRFTVRESAATGRRPEPAAERRRPLLRERAGSRLERPHLGAVRLGAAAGRRQRHHRRELDHPRRRRHHHLRRLPEDHRRLRDLRRLHQRRDRPDRPERPLRHGHAPRRDHHPGHAELAAELHHPDLRQQPGRPVLLRPDRARRQDARVRQQRADAVHGHAARAVRRRRSRRRRPGSLRRQRAADDGRRGRPHADPRRPERHRHVHRQHGRRPHRATT